MVWVKGSGLILIKQSRNFSIASNTMTDKTSQPQGNSKTCHICNRTFRRMEHLNRHIITHTRVRLWTCQFCSTSFARGQVRQLMLMLTSSDVLARHYETCERALQAGYRRSPCQRLRRSCQRCRKRKSRCDGQYPCSSCITAQVECHRPAPVIVSGTDDDGWVAELFKQSTAQSRNANEPIDSETLTDATRDGTLSPIWRNRGGSHDSVSTDENISSSDGILFESQIEWFSNTRPDTDTSGLVDSLEGLPSSSVVALQVAEGEAQECEEATVVHGRCEWASPISISKIDPFEAHRLTIHLHLLQSEFGSRAIAWLSSQNVRQLLFTYFQNFHRHLPFLHIPTWDVATIPTSLFLSMIIVGAAYAEDGDRQMVHAQSILPEAITLVYKLDEVFLSSEILTLGVVRRIRNETVSRVNSIPIFTDAFSHLLYWHQRSS